MRVVKEGLCGGTTDTKGHLRGQIEIPETLTKINTYIKENKYLYKRNINGITK